MIGDCIVSDAEMNFHTASQTGHKAVMAAESRLLEFHLLNRIFSADYHLYPASLDIIALDRQQYGGCRQPQQSSGVPRHFRHRRYNIDRSRMLETVG